DGGESEGVEPGAAVRQKRLDVKYVKKRRLVITTYETVRDYQVSLGQVDWGVMVLDEAQKIKNPTALVTTAAKAMKYEFGICLTGTPVENSWIDLWSILDFAIPGHLEPLTEFARKYHYPLRKHGTDVEALGRELKERVAPYFLRRTKEENLKGLPEKKVMYYRVPMPDYQLRRYIECVTQARRTLPDPQGGGRGRHILRAIHLLYEISLHPDLPCLNEACLASQSTGEFVSASAKLLKTFEILDDVRRVGEKAVIFLRSRKLQRLLQRAIYERYGLKTAIVNGETLGEVRKRLVDEFQAKPGFNVIIMSPDAAGVGLNVVAANHVIHLSRPWNPAKEDQATDRVYRIGQKKTVFVHTPLAVHPLFEGGSFDEKLDRLLSRKRQLSTTVLLPPQVEEWEKLSLAEDVIACDAGEPEEGSFLTLRDVDEAAPTIFEMIVAALFRKMGYVAEPTPTHDRGADVVAVVGDNRDSRGMLIQCKHVKRPGEAVGPAAVREIVAARGIYEPLHSCTFNLAVVTNAHGFTRSAVELADANGVTLVVREKLAVWLRDYPVEHAEVWFSIHGGGNLVP
ncbi:MAG: restriction endonuclease, partial [Firmicutes bacterium]|nr:restriction endonuclease [Bacillota bacterium]